ncbi:hypothetical protein [Pseudomonas silesiensis]
MAFATFALGAKFFTNNQFHKFNEEPALRLLDSRQVACHYAEQFLDGAV